MLAVMSEKKMSPKKIKTPPMRRPAVLSEHDVPVTDGGQGHPGKPDPIADGGDRRVHLTDHDARDHRDDDGDRKRVAEVVAQEHVPHAGDELDEERQHEHEPEVPQQPSQGGVVPEDRQAGQDDRDVHPIVDG